ncbi:hypothetical protein DRP05_14940 [Archaeoglobales archaeon]|nr:MAG: hypothetical protein DRP05_14940 [Archaeoglobales archaeon]
MFRIIEVYGSKTYEKGLEYYQSGRVALAIKCGSELTGEVVGNERYRVKVDLDSYHGTCSCPVRHNCKHAVALLLSYLNGDYFDVDNAISSAKKEDLAELAKDAVSENPFLVFKLDKSGSKFVEKRIKSLFEGYIDEEKADEIARTIRSYKNIISKDFVFWMLEYLLEYCEHSDCFYNDYYDHYYGEVIFEALCDALAEKELGDEDFERIEEIAKKDDFDALYPFFRRMIKHVWKFRRFDPRKYLSTEDYIEFLINAGRKGLVEILLKKANLDERTFFRLCFKIDRDRALKFAREKKLYSELIKCCEDIIDVFDRVVEEDAWIDEEACRIVFERVKATKNPSTLKKLADYCVRREYYSLAADVAIALKDYRLLKRLARTDINTRLRVFEFVESGEFVEDIKATIGELIDERKRESYRRAVKCLEKLKRLLSEEEWKEYVSNLYKEHKRKTAFWEEFESAFGVELVD